MAGAVPQVALVASGTLISFAAQLARTLDNADGIRAQLPPELHPSFDMAYEVQGLRSDEAGTEKDRRISLRTEEAVEKARAQRIALEKIRAEEKEALYSAAEAEGDAFEMLSSMDLEDLEEAQPLVENFLVKESVIRLYGPPKTYKSFVMLDIAGCVGAGMPWAGNKTVQSKVLYVVAEGVRGIKRRVRAWEAQNKRTMVGVHFYPKAVQIGDRRDVSTLIRTAKRGGYEFIILDTQARCTVGLEENSASEMGVVVAALDVLKEVTGACVALVHHSGASGGRARGSTAILGALDAEFEVEADKRSMSVKVITRAQKDLAEARDVELDLVTPGPGLALAVKPRPKWYQPTAQDLPELSASELVALQGVATFFDGAPLTMIANDLNINKGTLYKTLDGLLRKGCVSKQGATYKIGKHGQMHLDAANRE